MTDRVITVLCLSLWAVGCSDDGAAGGAAPADVSPAGDVIGGADVGPGGSDAAAVADGTLPDGGAPGSDTPDGGASAADAAPDSSGVADAPVADAQDATPGPDVADSGAAPDSALPDAADLPDSAGAADQADGQASDVTSPPDGSAPPFVILDPSSLTFFSVPINSIRYAVAGHDPQKHICATLIWDFSNNGEPYVAHCNDFYQGFPYVIVETDTDGPCGTWDYGTDLTTGYSTGCVDFAEFGPADMDLVDVNVHVDSAAFTGVIHANNLGLFDPPPIWFGIEYTTDIPEDVWALTAGTDGLPGWLHVDEGGAPVSLFPLCGVPRCDGGPTPPCGQKDVVTSLTGGDYEGGIHAAWDGRIHGYDEVLGCQTAEIAPDGAYEATLCFSWTVEGAKGGEGPSVECQTVPFTIPTEGTVTWHASFGG